MADINQLVNRAEEFMVKAPYLPLGLAKEMIAALKEQTPQWISVKERLPEQDGNYLVSVKLSYGSCPWYVCIAAYRHVHPDSFGCFGIIKEKEKQMYRGAVTHWMPLPEPPKEETK